MASGEDKRAKKAKTAVAARETPNAPDALARTLDSTAPPGSNTPLGALRTLTDDNRVMPTRTIASAVERPLDISADDGSLLPGTRIRQYEILREIGRGGMGQVLLARDTKLGRRVAMKFLITQSQSRTQRFLVEARTTAQLHHENIVVIHEVEEHLGRAYMVLEYLEGQTLRDVMVGNRVPAGRAVELMMPVARALVRAHQAGIIHRDLKPDNIFITHSGAIKVLDFGISKLTDAGGDHGEQGGGVQAGHELLHTQQGALVGTLPYMAPEQFGEGDIDERTDIWAVGVMLFEMLVGEHPVSPLTVAKLIENAAAVDSPMASLAALYPEGSAELIELVDACLQKRQVDRLGSAQQLAEMLEPLLPGTYGRKLAEGESPYPGLVAFQESDADRFFGRSREIMRMTQRVRESRLLGVVGPSGVGKSSFVRAGLVPSLKASGEPWETLIVRPGRDPLSALTNLLLNLTGSKDGVAEHDSVMSRLRSEPGFFGTALRSHARIRQARLLLFIDQFEELYTLVPDVETRQAFTNALIAAADDPSTPVRVVVSMRSDFIDRVSENQAFLEELTRGLIFLPRPDAAGLRAALTEPLEMVGYQFENPALVGRMIDELADSSGALPLLQFAATRLWEGRDRSKRLITVAAYEEMGGIAGTLATHADEVIGGLSMPDQRMARDIFLRLVTPEGTRAIVDISELRELSPDAAALQRLIDYIVQARLVVVHTRADDANSAVELVHESLIHTWPTLRRWLDESHEDAAFIEQLRTASRQWDRGQRSQGLLWRGEAMEEAARFDRRYKGDLPERERAYLDAALQLATRTARNKRLIIGGSFAVLLVLVIAAAVGLYWIRGAEQTATREADRAKQETAKARAAERDLQTQLEATQREQRARMSAEATKKKLEKRVDEDQATLKLTYGQLEKALQRATRDQIAAKKAQAAAEKLAKEKEKIAAAEKQARERMAKLLEKERRAKEALQKQRSKISNTLKE